MRLIIPGLAQIFFFRKKDEENYPAEKLHSLYIVSSVKIKQG